MPAGWHWEGALAWRMASIHYDPGVVTSISGLGASAGVSRGRFAILADYSDIGTHAPTGWTGPVLIDRGAPPTASNPDGNFHRLGVSGRYLLGRGALGGDDWATAWIEAGVGRELVLWDAGGRLHRNDFAVGIGGAIASHHARGHAGMYVSIVWWFAPRLRPTAATCGGPCNEATGASAFDRSVRFDLGIPFGG